MPGDLTWWPKGRLDAYGPGRQARSPADRYQNRPPLPPAMAGPRCRSPPGTPYSALPAFPSGRGGLADVLTLELEPAPDALSSALTYCDMTTSPDGKPVAAGQRLAEIQDRYGQAHLVSRSIQRATPMILHAVEPVHRRSARIA